MLPSEDRDAWLKRLGIDHIPEPTVATLRQIVRIHQHNIPFENIDVFCGRVPSLDLPDLVDKLIRNRRGGYCFELNALLGAGLAALGFDLRPLMARVLWEREEPGPRTHAVLLVDAEGASWLVDVGFGGPGPYEPLELNAGGPPIAIGNTAYRFEEDTDLGTVLARRSRSGGWTPLYAFKLDHVSPDDLAAGNRLAATSPGSIFRQGLKIARQLPEARTTLNGWELKLYAGAVRVEAKTFGRPAEIVECLTHDFGIKLDPSTRAELFHRLQKDVVT